ncbi:Com family DNA-binding transcriptional regulator [Acinetobacter courvalinii]|nr:Com family DNA-binding transcriptional regulator [Acinetobacter courvalinii]MBJ8418788.1 Com family DNA-binding transcriptional regulator [Acinetobacter courvalinii]
MIELRCNCGKLLGKIEKVSVKIEIKCPRCRVVNHWNV